MSNQHNRKLIQAKTFDKGINTYLLRAAIIGGIGGLCFGLLMAFAGGEGFDFLQKIENPVFRQILTVLICTFPFAIIGIYLAWRNWKIITWDTFTLNFNIGDSREHILETFGSPANETIKNNTTTLSYHTVSDKNRRISYKNINFLFSDNKLVKFNRF